MADIQFYEGDSDDSSELSSGGGLSGSSDDYDPESGGIDENLSPLQKLEKYLDSEHSYSRQLVARNLFETLKAMDVDSTGSERVLQAMIRLSDDPGVDVLWGTDNAVRVELMDQLASVALHCRDTQPQYNTSICTYLLPIVIKFLTDCNNQVRKSCHAALVTLVKDGLITPAEIEFQIAPVILDLAESESIDDFRTEAVTLMTRLAPLIGRALTERVFLQRFADMCTDALFHVRKVCALNFGEMCRVVGQHSTETLLLSKFFYLCEDGVWGVRNACAECFAQVSAVCSARVRRDDLAQLFISLICDQSRWVRMAAFQALGSFIATFADASVTGLQMNEEGRVVVRPPTSGGGVPAEPASRLSDGEAFNRNCDTTMQPRAEPPTPDDVFSDPTPFSAPAGGGAVGARPPCLGRQLAVSDGTAPVLVHEDSGISVSPPSVIGMMVGEEKGGQEGVNGGLKGATKERDGVTKNIAKEGDSGGEEKFKSGNIGVMGVENEVEAVEYSSFHYWRFPLSVDDDVISAQSPFTENPSLSPDAGELSGSEGNNTVMPAGIDIARVFTSSVESTTKVTQNVDTASAPSSSECTESVLPDVESEMEGVKENAPNMMESESTGSEERKIISQEETVGVLEASTEEVKVLLTEATPETKNLETVECPPAVENVKQTTVGRVGGSGTTILHAVEATVQTHAIRELSYAEVLTHTLATPSFDEYSLCSSYSGGINSTSEEPSAPPASQIPQCAIPRELLDHYLGMTEPSRAQTVDSEILKHCAYSLPAVAYTLGRDNWACIKDLYETLAKDMQWKVRRTLAFSLHEMALILGDALTCADLVPVFDEFLKDLDEVRIGVLVHLADFLRLLQPEMRRVYLTKLPEFMTTDNSRNWRFRKDLAEQMQHLLELYSPTDTLEHLAPMALLLAEDRVAQVRLSALSVLSGILQQLSTDECRRQWTQFVDDLRRRFASSAIWCRRQTFTQVCACVLKDRSVPLARFCVELLPLLLALSTDPVPNVRIALARALANQVGQSEYFLGDANPERAALLAAVAALRADPDIDVRRIMGAVPSVLTSSAPAPLALTFIDGATPVISTGGIAAAVEPFGGRGAEHAAVAVGGACAQGGVVDAGLDRSERN